MVSEIIKKEKEIQEENLKHKHDAYVICEIESHKQSLINLKEYLENCNIMLNIEVGTRDTDFNLELEEDIKELTKMIEAYK